VSDTCGTSSGTGGSAGAGGAPACPSGSSAGAGGTGATANVIDNMDDCNDWIDPVDGRQGAWWSYNSNCDSTITTKGTQTPPIAPCTGHFNLKFEMTPMTQGCAARTVGSGFPTNGWAGIGVSLAPSGCGYNACAWDGIKVTVTGSAVRMDLHTPPFDNYNDVGVDLVAGTQMVPWFRLASASTTSPKAFDCSQLQNLTFKPKSLASFDFTIDNLEFVKDEPSPVVAGCAGSSVGRYFCDDFESGPSKWTISGQDWALTTSTARSATNSVTDSPSGTYANDADAAITLAGTVNLTTATAPVLSFWQKLAVNGASSGSSPYYDYAYVEASTTGGLSWTQLAALRSTSNSSTWLPLQYDLSTYVGSLLKVRFRLWDNSAGSTSVADGWYLDDVEVREAPAPLAGTGPGGCPPATTTRYFCDSFEFGLASWTVATDNWNTTVFEARTGTHSATDSPRTTYLNNAHGYLVLSQPIDLTTATAPILAFWHKLAVNGTSSGSSPYYDYAYVDVSTNGGSTWTTAASYTSTNNTSTWSLQQVNLATYAGQRVQVRFRLWDNSAGTAYVADGWYLDDVEIRELM
jgi:hypothetical protein